MKSLIAALFLFVAASAWAQTDTTVAEDGVPRAGDRFYLQLDSLGSLQVGEVFEIRDDRYAEFSIRAKVVSVLGDVALIEVMPGDRLPADLASSPRPDEISSLGPTGNNGILAN